MANAEPTPPAVLRRKQVEARTGLARSTLYKLISLGQFPAPVRLTAKAVAWTVHDIDDWIASRIAASKND
ncbi:MAG: AlpA family transcriptional regulator [Hylemonella sp.]|nr:AlpA family transcriptional regulator [Hylemonella sp.]